MPFWKKNKSNIEVFSVHIPKTAGTSFRNILKSVYGNDQVVRFDIKQIGNALLNERNYTEKELPQVKVIHGHYNFKKLKAMYELPASYQAITWVRDPVKRVLSNFYYLESRLKDLLDEKNNNLNILSKMQRTLIEYARDKKNQNRQFKFLAGIELEDFDFIGIQEHYEDEISEIARILNWPNVPQVLHHNKTKIERPPVPEEWIEEIRALNKQDMAVYERALQLREERLHHNQPQS